MQVTHSSLACHCLSANCVSWMKNRAKHKDGYLSSCILRSVLWNAQEKQKRDVHGIRNNNSTEFSEGNKGLATSGYVLECTLRTA